jgi:hypothetical protein
VKIRELQSDSDDIIIRLNGMVAKLKNFADRIENNHLRMTILEKDFVGSTNSRKRTNQRMKDDTSDEYGMNLKKINFLY